MVHKGRNYISNREELTSHGNVSLRNITIDIIEYALEAADPYSAVMRLFQLDGDVLKIGDLLFDPWRREGLPWNRPGTGRDFWRPYLGWFVRS